MPTQSKNTATPKVNKGGQDKNYAFIDGQNLYMGTAKREIGPWKIDLARFRVYLEQKYSVTKAYYFLGFVQKENQDLYEEIQHAGFVLIFREHNPAMMGKKKGNVDSDIIFHIMKKMYKKENFNKIILVSGDGDYKLLVDFLIEEKRFEKILFPNKKFASSLYKELGSVYFDYLENKDIKNKIGVEKEKGSLGN
ncbi:MAG: NYN domain-containing protein [bacterium]|nr:NYN domain-containing protein [bacterium]